jgi:hypothetical protein
LVCKRIQNYFQNIITTWYSDLFDIFRRTLRFWNAAFLDSVHSEKNSPTLPRYNSQNYWLMLTSLGEMARKQCFLVYSENMARKQCFLVHHVVHDPSLLVKTHYVFCTPRSEWNNLSENDKLDKKEHHKNSIFGQLGCVWNRKKMYSIV